MKKQKKNIIFCIIILMLLIIKQILVSKIPLIAKPIANKEDALMISMADNILNGRWFGPYDTYVLIKGPILPLFLCFSKMIGIPFISFQTIFYTISSLIFIYGIKDLIKSKKYLLIIYAIILFNPISFANETLLRTYTNMIIMSEMLIIFGSYIGLFTNRKNKKQSLIYSIFAGIGVSMFFLSKEDALFVLPSIILPAIVLIILAIKENKKDVLKKCKLLILSYIMPIIILAFSVAIIMCFNFHYYGVFTYNEITNSAYTKCMKTIYSVDLGENIPNVEVTFKEMDEISKISPNFKKVADCLKTATIYDHTPENIEIDNSAFSESFRFFAAGTNTWETAKDSRDFYNQITNDIEKAFDEGKLTKKSVMPSIYIMSWNDSYKEKMEKIIDNLFDSLILYKDVTTSIEASEIFGNYDVLEKYKNITMCNIIEKEASNSSEELKKVPNEQIQILNYITKMYRYFNSIIFVISIIIFGINVLKMFTGIKNKKYGNLKLIIISSLLLASILFIVLKAAYIEVTLFKVADYSSISIAYVFMAIFEIITIFSVIPEIKGYLLKLKKERKFKKSEIVKIILVEIIVFLIICLALGAKWAFEYFNITSLDTILLQLTEPLDGTSENVVAAGIYSIFGYGIAIFSIVNLLYFYIINLLKEKIKCKEKTLKIIKIVLVCLVIITCLIYITIKTNLKKFISQQLNPTQIFEEKYVDPKTANITFPNEKRNLIYIILESIEVTFADEENAGIMEENLIPEITTLMHENINFSHNADNIGGIHSYNGTGWTIGSLVAQMSGLPLKLADSTVYEDVKKYLPGITTLGEVLKEHGYNQMFLCGSPLSFSGRDKFFGQHGDYETLDYDSAVETKRYVGKHENWGFIDKHLFEFAKEEITRLSKEDKPFNVTFLTVDTHNPSGYICEDCDSKHDRPYANAISCTSKQVEKFMGWVKEQPFYEDTTIVIIGDHSTMSGDFNDLIPEDYERSTVNCFINSAVTPTNTNNRDFLMMDMFPTILSSIGEKIEGERLGVGTNLFSDTKTIAEEMGIENAKEEFNKKSRFYTETFLKGE